MMEMVKEKPRRRSVSELLDWRCLAEGKGTGDENDSAGGHSLEEDREPKTRRRRRSGTWP